jgi:hypothetical protein
MTATVAHPTSRPAGLSLSTGLLILLWGFLSLAAGFRWFGDGLDYGEYVVFYSELGPFSPFGQTRFEPGYVFLAWLFKLAGAPYGLFAASLVGLSLGIKFVLIQRHTRWPLLASLCYVALFYFLHEYTQIRAALAIAFGLLGSVSFARGNKVKAALWLLVGATFQSSVLALGLGFALYMALASAASMMFLGVAAVAGALLVADVSLLDLASTFNPLVISYVENAGDFEPPNKYSPAVLLLAAAILFAAAPALRSSDAFWKLSLLMCVLALASFFALFDIALIANRMLQLFSVYVIFLSFQFRAFEVSALAGAATLLNAAWAMRNAVGQGLIG